MARDSPVNKTCFFIPLLSTYSGIASRGKRGHSVLLDRKNDRNLEKRGEEGVAGKKVPCGFLQCLMMTIQ